MYVIVNKLKERENTVINFVGKWSSCRSMVQILHKTHDDMADDIYRVILRINVSTMPTAEQCTKYIR
jgi:hypothetical protein